MFSATENTCHNIWNPLVLPSYRQCTKSYILVDSQMIYDIALSLAEGAGQSCLTVFPIQFSFNCSATQTVVDSNCCASTHAITENRECGKIRDPGNEVNTRCARLSSPKGRRYFCMRHEVTTSDSLSSHHCMGLSSCEQKQRSKIKSALDSVTLIYLP